MLSHAWLLRADRPDDATGVLGTWLLRLFSKMRPIVLDAVAVARNRSCSALAAGELICPLKRVQM